LIRRAEQHQEECPVSLVFGSGSTAFRPVHNDLTVGRAHEPAPYAAALFQERFKNRKLIRHGHRSLVNLFFCRFDLVAGSMFTASPVKFQEIGDDLIGFCPSKGGRRNLEWVLVMRASSKEKQFET
jgi:hypothetical protein